MNHAGPGGSFFRFRLLKMMYAAVADAASAAYAHGDTLCSFSLKSCNMIQISAFDSTVDTMWILWIGLDQS